MSARRWEAPRFEVLRTLSEIAEETKRPKRTVQRQLVAVHRADTEKGRGGWLFRVAGNRWLVNATMLHAVHPEFFSTRYFSRAEADVLLEDMETLKAKERVLTKALNATRARLRQEVERLTSVVEQNQLVE